MRIAIFTETYLPQINGVVTHIKILKEGLEALGHTVLIVTADSKTRKHYIDGDVRHTTSSASTGWIWPLRSAAPACTICANLTRTSSMSTTNSASGSAA